MVKSVLLRTIFLLACIPYMVKGQIVLDMPDNFVHLQARNGHKALIYEDSTKSLSIEFRYGFPKKYKDYAVLKLSQAIQATLDSNWTSEPPSISVDYGEINIRYNLNESQLSDIVYAFNLYEYPNYDSLRALKDFHSFPVSPGSKISLVDSSYTFPFSKKSNVHAKLFRSIYIETPSVDSTLTSIVNALELLPEVSPVKSRSYAKDGQLEFNTMETYPALRDSLTFCYAGPHTNNVTKYHATLLILQEYLKLQPNDTLGKLSISYVGGQSYLHLTHHNLDKDQVDSLIQHKVEQSVFSAEIAPLFWDTLLIDSIKSYVLAKLENKPTSILKDQLSFFDNEWAIYLPAELGQVDHESMQRMIDIFVNNVPFYMTHHSSSYSKESLIDERVFNTSILPTVNAYDTVESPEVFYGITKFLELNPMYNVSMVFEIGHKEIKWVKDTTILNYLLDFPNSLAAINQLKRIRRKQIPMGVVRGLTYFRHLVEVLQIAPERVRFNVIRLEKGLDVPQIRFNLSQSF